MQTPTPTDPRGALCADVAAPLSAAAHLGAAAQLSAAAHLGAAAPRPVAQPLFPPKDADAEARRRWLASSPWPEVVFAAAV